MNILVLRKFNPSPRAWSWAWICMALLLSGCGNRFAEQMSDAHLVAQSKLEHLKNELDKGQLTNARLLEKYADSLAAQKPDYAEIALLMKKEATSQGKAYSALVKRLAAVNLKPRDPEMATTGYREMLHVGSAAGVLEFNNSLADVVNTLASLSDGQLAVINVPSADLSTAQNANALVGNPSYGNWQRGGDGRSFWAWYGMYSMFGNVFGRRAYYYDSWSARPHYSYYGHYGRNRWGSSADVNRNHNLSQRHPSSYNKPTAATKTRYAATSRRSSSYGGSNKSSSKYGAYGSSSRSSSYSSSRGFRSGK